MFDGHETDGGAGGINDVRPRGLPADAGKTYKISVKATSKLSV